MHGGLNNFTNIFVIGVAVAAGVVAVVAGVVVRIAAVAGVVAGVSIAAGVVGVSAVPTVFVAVGDVVRVLLRLIAILILSLRATINSHLNRRFVLLFVMFGLFTVRYSVCLS